MKRISTIVMALALVLSLSQCKKNEQNNAENQGEAMTITLDVSGASTGSATDGSRVVVNPNTGTVDFENNDQIIVASGGKYVGTLTYNGTLFTGAISNATEGYPLQFYFLGNVTPVETLTTGITESCSVVISDQTEHLPVISAASSNENYIASTADYTAHLLNKCALVKFNVTTASESAICVTGFNNKVTVNFSENTLTNCKECNGIITLPAGNGEKWAILLPQEALEAGEARSGNYIGTHSAVPTITENGYYTVGVDVTVNTPIPVGSINGLFTINSGGDQVYFSQGNLQYRASSNSWRFAENQFDIIGVANNNISETYDGWIDLFGWGTSGYDHGAICYQPWSTSQTDSDYYAYGIGDASLNSSTGEADWGYNAISNGGNAENQWRTLTSTEWRYVIDYRSGLRYAKGVVNGMNGIILLPDDWRESIYLLNDTNQYGASYSSNVINLSDWTNIFEVMGAVFLPAAGLRNINTNSVATHGNYWTTSLSGSSGSFGALLNFYDASQGFHYGTHRYYGCSVRLVHDVE